MADRIGVMEGGRIHQWDSGYNLYHRPKTRFVADFIGQGEFVEATVVDEESIRSPIGVFRSDSPHGYDAGQQVDLLIRPDDVLHDPSSALTGEITRKYFRGSHFLYRVQLASQHRLICFADSHHDHAVGEQIGITLNVKHLVMFPKG